MSLWAYCLLSLLTRYLLVKNNDYILDNFNMYCIFDYTKRYSNNHLIVILSIIAILSPFFLITIMNVLILKHVKNKANYFRNSFLGKSYEKQAISSKPFLSSPASIINSAAISKNVFLNAAKVREIKITKSIVLISSTFCLSLVAYLSVLILSNFVDLKNFYYTPYFLSFSVLLAKTSSITYPIVYTLKNKECKEYFIKILPRSSKISTRRDIEDRTNFIEMSNTL